MVAVVTRARWTFSYPPLLSAGDRGHPRGHVRGCELRQTPQRLRRAPDLVGHRHHLSHYDSRSKACSRTIRTPAFVPSGEKLRHSRHGASEVSGAVQLGVEAAICDQILKPSLEPPSISQIALSARHLARPDRTQRPISSPSRPTGRTAGAGRTPAIAGPSHPFPRRFLPASPRYGWAR